MNPLVTVIIPTHNRELMVREAVLSVIGQTYTALEILVVDDGSTDNTAAILARCGDSRMRVIRQPHQGVSSARNKGLGMARGSFIAFLDSDDLWEPDKVALQLSHMVRGGWSIAQTDEEWVRNGRRVNPGLRHVKQAGWIFRPSLERCLVSPSCVMVHRSVFDRFGVFAQDLPACEDYDLWLRCTRLLPVGFLPRKLVRRRAGHSGQLSSLFVGMDLYRVRALHRLIHVHGLTPGQRKEAERVLGEKAARYITGCLKRGRMDEAARLRKVLSGG
ncbi:MAG: glycosyltransferase family 2 protein [Desulfohalobiaceae bacterium]